MNYPNYKVEIRRNSDGVIRIIDENNAWEDGEDDHGHTAYWWTEGNAGCDCNRHLCFERAAGNDPDLDDAPCGASRYSVLRFLFPDGTSQVCDQDAHERFPVSGT